jgi:HEAT repeat protein
MEHYSPRCWKPMPGQARVCPHCRAALDPADAEDYLTKLVGALSHPDYLTRRRAAFVLGWLHDKRAVVPLIEVLGQEADPYVRAEAVTAIGAIGSEEGYAALRQVVHDPAESVIARRAATKVLGSRQKLENKVDGR